MKTLFFRVCGLFLTLAASACTVPDAPDGSASTAQDSIASPSGTSDSDTPANDKNLKQCAADELQIDYVKGRATVTRGNFTFPAKEGTCLQLGDTVATVENAVVQLRTSGGAVARIGGNAGLTIGAKDIAPPTAAAGIRG